jgi:hypothetical protein
MFHIVLYNVPAQKSRSEKKESRPQRVLSSIHYAFAVSSSVFSAFTPKYSTQTTMAWISRQRLITMIFVSLVVSKEQTPVLLLSAQPLPSIYIPYEATRTNYNPYSICSTHYPTNQPTYLEQTSFNTQMPPSPVSSRFPEPNPAQMNPSLSSNLQGRKFLAFPPFCNTTRHHDSIQPKTTPSPQILIEAAAAPSTYKHPAPNLLAQKKRQCMCARAYVYISNPPITLKKQKIPPHPNLSKEFRYIFIHMKRKRRTGEKPEYQPLTSPAQPSTKSVSWLKEILQVQIRYDTVQTRSFSFIGMEKVKVFPDPQ